MIHYRFENALNYLLRKPMPPFQFGNRLCLFFHASVMAEVQRQST